MFSKCAFVPASIAVFGALNANADVIYDNLSAGTDEEAAIGDLAIDDLVVDGGGLLQSITVSLIADGRKGEIVMTDIMLSLAIDGGDGFPNLDGTGDDVFLLGSVMFGVMLTADEVTEITFDVSESYALVPDSAHLFGGVELSNPSVGHVFYGEPTVGTTDDFYISFMAMGPAPVPGFGDPDLEASEGLAFRIEATPLPPESDRGDVVGELIDFEDQSEGFLDTTTTIGSMTFSDGVDGFLPPFPGVFAIDDGTDVWTKNPDMLDFVDGKLLQLNTFTTGPGGYAFSIMKSMKMATGSAHSAIKMSIAYVHQSPDTDFSTSTITLLALKGGKMVASDTIPADQELGTSSGGSFTFGAGMLQISGVVFDSLVLFANGAGPFGSAMMAVDNIVIGNVAGSPDLDGDGVVGPADLAQLLGAWGPCLAFPECPADLDGDGMVGPADLALLLGSWG